MAKDLEVRGLGQSPGPEDAGSAGRQFTIHTTTSALHLGPGWFLGDKSESKRVSTTLHVIKTHCPSLNN